MTIKRALGVAAFVVGAFGMSASAVAEKVSWNYSIWGNPRAFTRGIEALVEFLKERTDGNFEITIHYGETISPSRQNLDGVSIGAFESTHLCTSYHPGKNPVGTVLDLPLVCEIGIEQMLAHAENPRISFIPADIRNDPVPAGHDLIVFKSMLHDWPEPDAQRFLAKAARSLEPGGTLPVCTVTPGTEDVRAYLAATGESAERWAGTVPPLMLVAWMIGALMERIDIPDRLLHTGQEFQMHRALRTGEAVELRFTVASLSVRRGATLAAFAMEALNVVQQFLFGGQNGCWGRRVAVQLRHFLSQNLLCLGRRVRILVSRQRGQAGEGQPPAGQRQRVHAGRSPRAADFGRVLLPGEPRGRPPSHRPRCARR